MWRPFGGGSFCKSVWVSEACFWRLIEKVYRKEFLDVSSNANRKEALLFCVLGAVGSL